MLNWDPGNAAARGEKPYPDGYDALPKGRIGHVHCKDVVDLGDGEDGMGGDGQGRHRLGRAVPRAEEGRLSARGLARNALAPQGGTPEESTRQSLAGMKELLRKADAA